MAKTPGRVTSISTTVSTGTTRSESWTTGEGISRGTSRSESTAESWSGTGPAPRDLGGDGFAYTVTITKEKRGTHEGSHEEEFRRQSWKVDAATAKAIQWLAERVGGRSEGGFRSESWSVSVREGSTAGTSHSVAEGEASADSPEYRPMPDAGEKKPGA
jgi:hypothetical protein